MEAREPWDTPLFPAATLVLEARLWWDIPLIPTPMRSRQKDLFQGYPELQETDRLKQLTPRFVQYLGSTPLIPAQIGRRQELSTLWHLVEADVVWRTGSPIPCEHCWELYWLATLRLRSSPLIPIPVTGSLLVLLHLTNKEEGRLREKSVQSRIFWGLPVLPSLQK